MNGSARFVELLGSVHTLLANYPVQSDIAAIEVEVDAFGRDAAVVRLWPTTLATLAAGLVEWDRTLACATASIWRTTAGRSVHVTVSGRSDEGDVPVRVWGSTVYHEHLFGPIQPGQRHPIDMSALRVWAIGGGPVVA